jgi:hypothetical protein
VGDAMNAIHLLAAAIAMLPALIVILALFT